VISTILSPAAQTPSRCHSEARIHPRPSDGPFAPVPLALAALALTLAAPFFSALFTPASAAPRGPVLAEIKNIHDEGLVRQDFVVRESTPVWIEAEGLADPKGTVFLSQGWILDLAGRKPVWSMSGAHGTWDHKTRNWRTEEEVTLPAGTYSAFFAAVGGRYPIDKDIRILGLSVGRIEGNWGPTVKWNEEGEPGRWGLRAQAMDAGYQTSPAPDPLPQLYPDAPIRFLGLANHTVRRAALDLDRTVEFEVRMTGEYSSGAKEFADGAWLTELTEWRRVWAPDKATTTPAGGDDKNRMFSGTMRVPEGQYLVTMATDESHAAGNWNAPPPWDPDSWGLAMWVKNPADQSAAHVKIDVALPEPAVAIARVADDAFVRKPFTVTRPVHALVRALGERSGSHAFADYGWIERAADLEPIWRMQDQEAYWAGGADKNWMVECVTDLAPGDYALCYATDDSHAYGDWNAEMPWEPDAWGISLAELNGSKGAIQVGPSAHASSVIALAPVRSDQELVKHFDISAPTKVLLIAEGEGVDGDMIDYGWLDNEDTGKEVWRMRYKNTEPAGGAHKNRIERVTLELPKGSYAIHFETDDSHAFGDWNDTAPTQPQLWGVTLIEKD
jgi:hypothetical protein